jgi:hypothetical protein
MIRRILRALVNRYRAARKRQQLRENRSLIARVKAEAARRYQELPTEDEWKGRE